MICFRCGETVADGQLLCPSCGQNLMLATIAATPHAVRQRDAATQRTGPPERPETTQQISESDILEEHAAEEADVLVSVVRPRRTTQAFETPGQEPRLEVMVEPPRRPLPPPGEEEAVLGEPTPLPEAARAAAAPSFLEAEGGAPAAPPWPTLRPATDLTAPVDPLPRASYAPVPARRRESATAALLVGVAAVVAVGTLAGVVCVSRQDALEDQARREHLKRWVEERRAEAAVKAKTTPAAGDAIGVAVGPDGCPQGMRRVAAPVSYCIDIYEYPGGHTLPRVNVTWREAVGVCEARGARMCTAAEWEHACRGERAADYPYGPHFETGRCNISTSAGRPREIVPAGTFTECKSAAGMYDMVGNVAEWVDESGYRGGSAANGSEARCSASVAARPDDSSPYVGFRCCANPAVTAGSGAASAPARPAEAP